MCVWLGCVVVVVVVVIFHGSVWVGGMRMRERVCGVWLMVGRCLLGMGVGVVGGGDKSSVFF
jgi:hypothetical protein